MFVLTEKFAKKEDYELIAQLRNSAESISSILHKLLEGDVIKIKVELMTLARNEAFETKNHLIYGNNVKYFTDEEIKTIIEKNKRRNW